MEYFKKEPFTKLFPDYIKSVQVVKMHAGSVVATVALHVKDSSKNKTKIVSLVKEHVRTKYTDMNPTRLRIQSNVCITSSGTNTCGPYASCTRKGGVLKLEYECTCNKGYTKNTSGNCQEEDADWLVAVFVPIIVICGLIALIFLIIGFKRKRKHNLDLEKARIKDQENGGVDNLNFKSLDEIEKEQKV